LPLGAGASQRYNFPLYPVIPIARHRILPDLLGVDLAELSQRRNAGSRPDLNYNLFDFANAMSPLLFIPMLIVLVAIPALLALYAGFAVARVMAERRPSRAAAWGAIVGPAWAIVMVVLATLARKEIVGDPTGDSVFIAFLLGGAALGSVGGLLAAEGETA
ncbi:MAG: hypothetical protein ACHQCF_06325, partial [Solirubrobacterales bacterium]